MADATRADVNPWGWALMAAGDGLQACADACAEWQQEVARFADARLAENRKSWAAALETHDLAGLMQVQGEWGLKAATDYGNETMRLARIAMALSLTGTTPAVQNAARIVG